MPANGAISRYIWYNKNMKKKLLLIAAILMTAIGAFACLWTRTEFSGLETETAEVFSVYEDKVKAENVHVLLPFWREEVKVSTVKGLDINKTGEQELVYQAGDKTVTKTVRVVDTEKPVITLVQTDGYTLPGHEYVEEGYKAFDNYDGELTDKVSREVKEGRVIYAVSDAAGNETSVTREIVFDMRKAPVIKTKNQSITEGTKFKDSYSATDEAGNDITSLVTVSGTVDTAKPGTYTLNYEVTDSCGNKSSAKATVKVVKKKSETVKPAEPVKPADPVTPVEDPVVTPGSKVIYLTFDDGPSAHEMKLLDILDQYNVKVTFFVTGSKSGYRKNFTEMHKRGHVVAVHTYTHNYSQIYKSASAYWDDFKKIQDVIYEYTGTRPNIFRFPGGSSNTVSKKYCKGVITKIAAEAKEKGLVYFDWNVSSGDAGAVKTAAGVLNNLKKGVAKKKTSVVLCHSSKSYTVEAMKDFIPWALKNGYVFKVLTSSSPQCHHRIAN